MKTPAPVEGVDTRDMLVVHAALRREFGLAPGLVRGVADGDVARARIVGRHVRLLLDLLHVHHGGEDRLLWPLLLVRVPAQLAPVIELMERQHRQIEATIEVIDPVLDRWVAGSATDEGVVLAAALDDLSTALDEHLLTEEERMLPLAAAHLSPAEWGRLAEEVKRLPIRVLPVAFGMLLHKGDPEVVEVILAQVPALPRLVLPRLAPRAYARHARRVHGTSTP